MTQYIKWRQDRPGAPWQARVGDVLRLYVEEARPGAFNAEVATRDGDRMALVPETFADPDAARQAAEAAALKMLRAATAALEADGRALLLLGGVNPQAREELTTLVEQHQGRITSTGAVQIEVPDHGLAAAIIFQARGMYDTVRWLPMQTPPRPAVEHREVSQVRWGLTLWVEREGHRIIDTEGQMHTLRLPSGTPTGATGWLIFDGQWSFTPDE